MIEVTFRPIDVWPGELTRSRSTADFMATWDATLQLLDRELRALKAKQVVVMLALPESAIRGDGWPRAQARPDHPGVIVAFDSMHGPLKYMADRFDGGRSGYAGKWKERDDGTTGRSWREAAPGWQCNLRAIALGLEALRKVDRYGITKRGEQYTGWKALPSGTPMPASGGFSSAEDAAAFIAEHANASHGDIWCDVDALLDEPDVLASAVRDAAKVLHPDAGGDVEQFQRLQAARDLLGSAR